MKRSSQGIARLLATFAIGITCCSRAAITYVDATAENTTFPSNVPLVTGLNHTTGSNDVVTNGLWHLRSGIGNGSNGIWTAKGSPIIPRGVTPLVTTLNLPGAGGYSIYAYVWSAPEPEKEWSARFRLGTNSPYVTVKVSDLQPARSARFNNPVLTTESSRTLYQVPLGIIIVSNVARIQIWVDDKTGLTKNLTWYDGVGYEKVFGELGEREMAIDFNKSESPGAPTQASFRVIAGSSKPAENPATYLKQIGSCQLRVFKNSSENFEFRGANGDPTRVIPGGSTSHSFLVSDFIASRDGTINLEFSGLPRGIYLFRSYHLEPLDADKFGFAQGATTITQNTLRAQVHGELEGILQPTSVGSVGLNTTSVSDDDIPQLNFAFNTDGTNPVTINLSTTLSNTTNHYIFMNGFEVFATKP